MKIIMCVMLVCAFRKIATHMMFLWASGKTTMQFSMCRVCDLLPNVVALLPTLVAPKFAALFLVQKLVT
jgi:hypothetical protein